MAETTAHGDPIDPTDPRPEPMGPLREGHCHHNKLRYLMFDEAMKDEELSGAPYPHDRREIIFARKWNPTLRKWIEKFKDDRRPDASMEPNRIFWSTHRRTFVGIYDHVRADGTRYVTSRLENRGPEAEHKLALAWNTADCDQIWSVYEEKRAMWKLKQLLENDPGAYRQYWMTGQFTIESPRSKLMYVFRKLRPTVVVASDGHGRIGDARILCTLCTHPVAYYGLSYAGALCPTDDVIAHLMLLWTDEHLFWKKSRQHSVDDPNNGI